MQIKKGQASLIVIPVAVRRAVYKYFGIHYRRNHRDIEEENLRTEHHVLVYIFLSALLFTMACAQNHKRPNWADNNFIPANTSRAYYAVRSGHSTVDNRQVVRNEAIADISAQIETEIRSEIVRQLREEGTAVSDNISIDIRTQTSGNFFGDDLKVQEYVDKKKEVYWVMVVLEKSVYQRRLKQQQQLSSQNAYAGYLNGLKAEKDKRYVEALVNYNQALNDLHPFKDFPLTVNHEGKSLMLRTAIPERMRQLVNNIGPEPSLPSQVFKFTDAKAASFIAHYYEGLRQYPVASLPLSFAVTRGAADIDKTGTTGSSGIAKCKIGEGDWGKNGLQIEASTNWQELFKNEAVLADFSIDISTPKKASTDLVLKGPIILGKFSYNGDKGSVKGSGGELNVIRSMVVNYMSDKIGAEFSEKSGGSDAQLSVDIAGSALGQVYGGFRTVSLTASIELVDLGANRAIYSPASTTVKGVGTSDAAALNNGIKKLEQLFKSKILPELTSNFVR